MGEQGDAVDGSVVDERGGYAAEALAPAMWELRRAGSEMLTGSVAESVRALAQRGQTITGN